VTAALGELETGAGDEVDNGAGHEDFSRLRQGLDALGDARRCR
jgi:hypothetical protein